MAEIVKDPLYQPVGLYGGCVCAAQEAGEEHSILRLYEAMYNRVRKAEAVKAIQPRLLPSL